jgi:anti-anti-sigma factor
MDSPYRQIEVARHGDVFCVRLLRRNMAEEDLHELSDELTRLIETGGCRKMVVNLGPNGPLCLYSIFLAKLVSLQRRLQQAGGGLQLAHVSPEIYKIFEACKLQALFEFVPDQDAGILALSS